MAGLFDQMVQNMQRMGFFQYLFPFLLAFAILYGVLGYVFKTKLGNRVIALISVILSFFVMLYSAANPWLYVTITSLSGIWLSIAVFILFVVVLMALAGVNLHEIIGGEKRWVKWVIVLVLLYVILSILITVVLYLFAAPAVSTASMYAAVIIFLIIAVFLVLVVLSSLFGVDIIPMLRKRPGAKQ